MERLRETKGNDLDMFMQRALVIVTENKYIKISYIKTKVNMTN